MVRMAAYEHLVKSYDIGDQLDDIASADPPAYLRRCFAEGDSASSLSWSRVQQLAVCAMVIDAVVNGRDYESFEHELIADWRIHYAGAFAKLKEPAAHALSGILERNRPQEPAAAAELESLAGSLGKN
jgi:hypothetical protein